MIDHKYLIMLLIRAEIVGVPGLRLPAMEISQSDWINFELSFSNKL